LKACIGHWHVKYGGGVWPREYVSLIKLISFKRHRFPPDIIQHAVWLYARFTLSFRDVEDMLAEG
jgi:hypothetical protein